MVFGLRRWSAALPWVARAGLIAILVLALVGVLNPELRPTEIEVRPDQVSHAIIIYGLTLLAALSFPRTRPRSLALIFLGAAIAVELAQRWAFVSGTASIADLVADAVGILAALAPLAIVRGRRVARAARAVSPPAARSRSD